MTRLGRFRVGDIAFLDVTKSGKIVGSTRKNGEAVLCLSDHVDEGMKDYSYTMKRFFCFSTNEIFLWYEEWMA